VSAVSCLIIIKLINLAAHVRSGLEQNSTCFVCCKMQNAFSDHHVSCCRPTWRVYIIPSIPFRFLHGPIMALAPSLPSTPLSLAFGLRSRPLFRDRNANMPDGLLSPSPTAGGGMSGIPPVSKPPGSAISLGSGEPRSDPLVVMARFDRPYLRRDLLVLRDSVRGLDESRPDRWPANGSVNGVLRGGCKFPW
jgi:hypothetical protein